MKGAKCRHKEIVILMFNMINASVLVSTEQGWSYEIQVFTLANRELQSAAFERWSCFYVEWQEEIFSLRLLVVLYF